MPTITLNLAELWCIRNCVRSNDHGKVWDREQMSLVHDAILELEDQIDSCPAELQATKLLSLHHALQVSEDFAWAIEQQVPPAWMWGPHNVGMLLVRKVMRSITGRAAPLTGEMAQFLEEISHGADTDPGKDPSNGASQTAGDGPSAPAVPG